MENLSKRGQYTLKFEDFSSHYMNETLTNLYDPIENPKGIVNLGMSVNRLMEREIQDRLSQKDVLNFRSVSHQHYFPLYGTPQLRESLAKLFQRWFKPKIPVTANEFIVTTGSTAGQDCLAHALFDPGDAVVSPTPIYARTFSNFQERAMVEPFPLHLSDQPDNRGERFALHPEDLEKKVLELRSKGKTVKAVAIVSPVNPLGQVYSRETLEEVVDLCHRQDLHLIVDEVYAFSAFGKEFTSVLSLDLPNPDKVHLVWGFSKDAGLAGFRVGVVHTRSPSLLKALRTLAFYPSVPSIIQDTAATLLDDVEWFDNYYIRVNQSRLRQCYLESRDMVQRLGLEVLPCDAGFFLFVRLTPFLREHTKQAEKELFEELYSAGVYIVPGSEVYCASPGWVRVVFSISREEMQEGLKRMNEVLQKRKLRHQIDPTSKL